MSKKRTVLKPMHSEPGDPVFGYFLLPYGIFYEKTRVFLDAKKGDTMRFFNGPECKIEKVEKVSDPNICDLLCRIRYGVSWSVAFRRWLSYALMEGNGKDILSPSECILVAYRQNEKD